MFHITKKFVVYLNVIGILLLIGCYTKEQPKVLTAADQPTEQNIPEKQVDLWLTFYVKADGNDNNTGTTEESPFRTLKKALSQLKNASSKTIVVLGTLDPLSEESSDEDSVFVIKDSGPVEINIAGKPGTEAVLSARASNKRVLSVTGASRIHFQHIELSGGTSNEAGGGIFVGSGATVTLADGTRILNNSTVVDGGGIFLDKGSSMTINGATVSDNRVDSLMGYGGGIYLKEGSTVFMSNGIIQTNRSSAASGGGGGVFVDKDATFTVTGGSITGNSATDRGGGVYVASGGDFSGISFVSDNTASNGKDTYREQW
ncbi:MAG: hypothetical protein LBQ77_04935 [Treponema sp.]|jgi:hypothetical protein|nr:hypothetical protein [Treponema sp.]